MMSVNNKQTESANLLTAAKVGDVSKVFDNEARYPNRNDFRPLHWSAQNGHNNVVVKLLNMAVNANARENRGRLALHSACFRGHEEIAQLLIGREAILDALDNEDFTPLMVASQEGGDIPI
ncbi:unnamed protein product [Meganyctiphanes norvegica]|uniref:Uncharacterized protein n=1 Tax=Meganyctiphanes norvegica TaxID=48144 RepID=A0AAV2S7Y0_MEGNR